MFWARYTDKKVDIKHANNDFKAVSIAISNGLISFTLQSDYFVNKSKMVDYTGRGKGKHGALILTVKFNDKTNTIIVKKGISKSFKIVFYDSKDYDKIKNTAIYYKLMDADKNSIKFIR